jgi:hypothetical protein
MKRSRKSANPFYVLLVVAGIAFVVTAALFCVLVSRTMAPGASLPVHPLMLWMDRHGMSLLIAELVLLIVCTFGAIGTDSYWQRRAANSQNARQNR